MRHNVDVMAEPRITSSRAEAGGRAFEAVCDRIRERIAAGELKAGDKLPAERDMAGLFGVGRNAVREALRSLEMAGVVRLAKGRNGGAFIRPANASRVTHAFGDLLDYGSIHWPELTEARSLVLDGVVRLACERAVDSDFEALERNLDETDEATEDGRLDDRDRLTAAFYTLLAVSARNGVLVLLVTSMSDLVRRFVAIASLGGRQPIATLVASRRRILRALRERNADAAVAEMNAHLLLIHKVLEHKVGSSPVSTTSARAVPGRTTPGGAASGRGGRAVSGQAAHAATKIGRRAVRH